MRTHGIYWEAFPTDVTSPTPTQLSGPEAEPQRTRTDVPEKPRQQEPPPEPEKDRSEDS